MLQDVVKKGLLVGVAATMLTACATSTLVKKGQSKNYTRTEKITLVEDQVVAFGKPAVADANLPADSIVIAGQQHSYILTYGGKKFATLIGHLDAKNIQINKALDFYSEKNDGHFSGSLPLSYVKLKEDISKQDMAFFIEHGAKECSTSSDERMQAQRFCFDIQLSGVVYPAAKNLSALKPLSKAYRVKIYTTQEQSYQSKSSMNPLEKVVLFPFAVAIDVISLPFQAAEKIFD